MSDKDHLIELDDFSNKVVSGLQIHFLNFDINALIHIFVVNLRNNNAWEQVTRNTSEQWQIEGQKFSQIDIIDSSQHDNRLVLVREFTLEVTSCGYDGFDCSHTIVIVIL